MDWRAKGIIQKTLSIAPGGVKLNTLLQHTFGEMRKFDSHLARKINDWSQSMGYLSGVDFPVAGARLMEIGSGWHPALPICFVLAGVDSVKTFDLVRLLSEGETFRLLDSLEKYVPNIAGMAGTDPTTVHTRLREFRRSKNLSELLGKSRIEYFAPVDARATGLEADSIDLVYSNSVLEHVQREVMAGLMEESFRVLTPGGLALHNVACNDHYANFDKSISHVNFLRYGEREWKLWNNPIQYQNRMRAPEFVDLAMQAGFEIISRKTNIRPGTTEALAGMRIAPEFVRFSADEIAATTVDFIGRKPMR